MADTSFVLAAIGTSLLKFLLAVLVVGAIVAGCIWISRTEFRGKMAKEREKTIEEVTAYAAEGSIEPDVAERLVRLLAKSADVDAMLDSVFRFPDAKAATRREKTLRMIAANAAEGAIDGQVAERLLLALTSGDEGDAREAEFEAKRAIVA